MDVLEEPLEGVHAQMSNPTIRMVAPATKPAGREGPTPRYGNGSVNTYIAIGTATTQIEPVQLDIPQNFQ